MLRDIPWEERLVHVFEASNGGQCGFYAHPDSADRLVKEAHVHLPCFRYVETIGHTEAQKRFRVTELSFRFYYCCEP